MPWREARGVSVSGWGKGLQNGPPQASLCKLANAISNRGWVECRYKMAGHEIGGARKNPVRNAKDQYGTRTHRGDKH